MLDAARGAPESGLPNASGVINWYFTGASGGASASVVTPAHVRASLCMNQLRLG